MRKGEIVSYRMSTPRDGDDGWRPAMVLSRTNKGYVLHVMLDPNLDRDRMAAGTYGHAHNCNQGEEVGQFMPLNDCPGLDGEKSGQPSCGAVLVKKALRQEEG